MKKISRILKFKKIQIILKKYTIIIKYINQHFNEKLSIVFHFRLLMKLLGFNIKLTNNKNTKFTIKSSKIIVDKENKDQNLYIFDRPFSEEYCDAREKFSLFHFSPDYKKIDEFTFFQKKSLGYGDMLSLNIEQLSTFLYNYINSQINFSYKFGKKISFHKFINKPYNFLLEKNYLNQFTPSTQKRIKRLYMSSELLTVVPSIIEPWPNIHQNKFEFSDLSPVEFEIAPVFHDFFYMLMKYEMYGTQKKNFKPFLNKLFNEFKKIEKKDYETTNSNLNKLVNKIKSIFNYDELLNFYILMMIFHSFKKYNATGKFLFDLPDQRLNRSVKIHAKIFNQINGL